MKKIFHLSVTLFLLCHVSFGQAPVMTKTGTTAASFLKIGIGARSIAMGGAFTAVANDVSSIYWNPAGLASLQSGEVLFNHIDWLADTKYDNAMAGFVVEGVGTIGVSFVTMNVGEMEVTTTSSPEGTGEKFTAGSTMVGLSYARNLTDKFAIGFNVKYIREHIWNESAQTFALDFGTIYTTQILNGLRIGASISNFGSKMRLEGRDILTLQKLGGNIVNAQYELDSYDLPLLFRVGVASDIVRDEYTRITLAVDAVHPNDNTEYVNSGIEYSWANVVAIRGGWKSAFERGTEQGLTFGGGIHYDLSAQIRFLIDYAYQDFGRLKPVHNFTFGLTF